MQGTVESVVSPHELVETRLEWVTRSAHHLDLPDLPWVVLRLTVVARDDELTQREIWGPDWPTDWEQALHDLATHLEDWVSETRFGWGQLRSASVPG